MKIKKTLNDFMEILFTTLLMIGSFTIFGFFAIIYYELQNYDLSSNAQILFMIIFMLIPMLWCMISSVGLFNLMRKKK